MNTFIAIHAEYIRSDRTIETILVKNKKHEKVFFVYNDQGCSFRVFENVLDLMSFFEDKFEPKISFDDENELDKYFEKVVLN
jgi:hypothetical protein